MGIFTGDIAVDLGTKYTRIYVKGHGLKLEELSVARVRFDGRRNKKTVVSVGNAVLHERVGSDEKIIWPIKNGTIHDYEVSLQMLDMLLSFASGRSRLGKPRIFISYPECAQESDKLILKRICEDLGFKRSYLIPKPFAAAAGLSAKIKVFEPNATMLVDMGAGTIDIAIVSLGGVFLPNSIQYGGNKIVETICSHFNKPPYQINISEEEAEEIMINLGSLVPWKNKKEHFLSNSRKSMLSSIDKKTVDSDEIYKIMEPFRNALCNGINFLLKSMPLPMVSDVMEQGIYFTGGLSYLPGIQELIAKQFNLPVSFAYNQERAAIEGLAYIIDNFDETISRGITSFLGA